MRVLLASRHPRQGVGKRPTLPRRSRKARVGVCGWLYHFQGSSSPKRPQKKDGPICHLTSAIQDAFFSILLTQLDGAALRATGNAVETSGKRGFPRKSQFV